MCGSVPTEKPEWCAVGQTSHKLTRVPVRILGFFSLIKQGLEVCVTCIQQYIKVFYSPINQYTVAMFYFFTSQQSCIKMLFPYHKNQGGFLRQDAGL